MLPAAQTVEPVYPVPPHCPYLATAAPVAVAVADVVVAALLVVVVLAFTDVAVDVVAFAVVVGDEPPAADCPLQTAGPGTV